MQHHPDDLRALEPQTPAQSVRTDARNAGAAAGGGACAEDTCQPPVAAALSPAEALVAMMQEAEANVAVAQHSQQLGKVRNVFSLCCLSSFSGRPLRMRPRTPLCANAAPRVFACARLLSPETLRSSTAPLNSVRWPDSKAHAAASGVL